MIEPYEMTELGHEYEDPNKLQDAQYEIVTPVTMATKEKEGFDYTHNAAYAPTSAREGASANQEYEEVGQRGSGCGRGNDEAGQI